MQQKDYNSITQQKDESQKKTKKKKSETKKEIVKN